MVLAVAGAVTYTMVAHWGEIVQTFRVLSWKSMVVTVLAIAASMACSVKVWQHLLEAMGTQIRFGHAAQVNLVGQLGKYLPGSVWAFVLQAQLGKQFKIPRARALVALLLAAGMSIVTAGTVGALAAPSLSETWGGWAWLLLLGPLGLVTLAPPLLTRIANLAIRAMRRLELDANLRGKHVTLAALWSFGAWIFLGLHIWLLTGSLARQTVGGYVLCMAAIALAMAAGFVAFILPSGIGVREAILVAGLSPIASVSQALAIALASRILFTFADLLSALGGLIASRITLRTRAGGHIAETRALSEHRGGK
ncbi:lysylphosphatidylglycerol synthase domain-containing protein [Blastococcus sp. Marseille-P5729]|uniref:lysylphosphatidylglycerol synthase domain-containing protein n=1 Tax=Blastococcus sp. Marseille-P5729 TaxID=2086582 RepID=UPI00131B89F1|nr:lysylphosphatidylglycerol synthase domain-containing protein [Blastococcus sp. Marseille-P5729]